MIPHGGMLVFGEEDFAFSTASSAAVLTRIGQLLINCGWAHYPQLSYRRIDKWQLLASSPPDLGIKLA
jgi:hypothetical protein